MLQPIRQLVSSVGFILNALIPILITAAIVVFFWGLIQYIRADKSFKDAGKNIMIAGLVALFVMVSVWGIIALAQNALGVPSSATVTIPQLPVAN